ncbi:MAG TPA: HAMP domain-containing sensor histidine kinase [Solirubrobacteraceae bacterium]|nr:HAMP domain-containing sensor histidine kinase [Solirubrobacteraceae bacterium]
MPARPRLGALGLRGRIVGAVLVTAVAALAVAAVVLLGPLESSLRSAEQKTLSTEVPRSSSDAFAQLNLGAVSYGLVPQPEGTPKSRGKDVHIGSANKSTAASSRAALNAATSAARGQAALRASGLVATARLSQAEKKLGEKVGAAEVAVLGYAEPSGRHLQMLVDARRQAVVWPDEDLTRADLFDDAGRALRAKTPRYTLGSIGGVEYARAAIPFTTPSVTLSKGVFVPRQRWVLIVRKRLDEVSSAVSAVRTAFFVAALVALALTLLIGIPLSARVVRRLRRLRQAALQLAEGAPSVAVPVDRARDEVGDLARTFALMQLRLQQQEEARRAFVATASHELRTPLATLDGMLELLDEDLQSGTPDLEDAQSLLVRARVQSRRLGRLAADLLDLSRIDAQVELRSEPVELSELSRAVLAEFELGSSERDIGTVLDDPGGSVWALGDPGSVARILRILLDNAVRLSPQGSEVIVELRNGSKASLTVRDQGPGVPPEERELIFERFMRGRETAGTAGFGLGLAIGRELAARMGGELVLEDDGCPGATFTLRLPVAHAPDEEPVAVG